MSARSSHVPIPGSEYPAVGASVIAPADPQRQIQATIVLRPRKPAPELHLDREFAERLPRERQFLSREDFETHHGPDADELRRVERFARACGI